MRLAASDSLSLEATPETCFWGYFSSDQPPVMRVASGAQVVVEAVTHHAGDAPDLMMDDGIRAIWDGIPAAERTPGVHIMTGPIEIEGAEPGDALRVDILEMAPRLRYGSNCAAHWGLLHDRFGKERITIYGLDDPDEGGSGFGPVARPLFGFDFDGRELYDVPGFVSTPDESKRQPFAPGRDVRVPVRRSSIPPGTFGGNVDNWRFGPGAMIFYPVSMPGAGFFVGDPHFAQGDGEVCGTAIEASLDVRLELSVVRSLKVTTPTLFDGDRWYTHGFGDDLDSAMRMAAEEMLRLLVDVGGFTLDEAYSLSSVAVDLGITQVVDGTVGCHASVGAALLGDPPMS